VRPGRNIPTFPRKYCLHLQGRRMSCETKLQGEVEEDQEEKKEENGKGGKEVEWKKEKDN
jgi:hypothetical protein